MKTKEHDRLSFGGVHTEHWLEVGGDTYLNRDTPLGLFEGCNGSRYLVTADFNVKVAVVLRHRYVRAFTWQALSNQPLDHGTWWGTARLRLTRRYSRRGFGIKPGNIELYDGGAGIHCWSVTGAKNIISLGEVGEEGDENCEYDAWSIQPVEVSYLFFQRLRDRRTIPGAKSGDKCILDVILMPAR